MRHIIVVGGGASGIMAAIAATKNGAKVTVLEQKDRIGKKILSTGNGRCNLTNTYMDIACFHGDDTRIVTSVLEQFGYEDCMNFFEELGVILKERQGYIYPYSDQATTILDALQMELKHLGVEIKTEECVVKIKSERDMVVAVTKNQKYVGDAIILSTGGKAAPVLGSDGKGYELAKNIGHHISPVVPALVQLRCAGTYFKQIAGIRTQAKVSLFVDNQYMASDIGELQLTNYGISGIPVFQISRFASKALHEKQNVQVEVDFFPHMTELEFHEFMMKRIKNHSHKTAEEFVVGLFNNKLGQALLKEAAIPSKVKIADVFEEKMNVFINLCKHLRMNVDSTNDFEQAQVCAGGVITNEINPQTLQSVYDKNIYIIGELVDIDGICGGYNLQWAWSTGYIAGKHAAKG